MKKIQALAAVRCHLCLSTFFMLVISTNFCHGQPCNLCTSYPCEKSTIEQTITTTVVWNTNQLITNDLVVMPGGELIIEDCTINFAPGVAVHVSAADDENVAGKLIADNVTFRLNPDCSACELEDANTNCAPAYWRGIVCYGYSGEDQFDTNGNYHPAQGFVQLTECNLIDAFKGAASINGGILIVKQCYFEHNLISICYLHYNPTNRDKIANEVSESEFVLSEVYGLSQNAEGDPVAFPAVDYGNRRFIHLENITGVDINGCIFTNVDPMSYPQNQIPNERGLVYMRYLLIL